MPTPGDEQPTDYAAAVAQHGGIRPAARALGIPESTIRSRILRDTSRTPAPSADPEVIGAVVAQAVSAALAAVLGTQQPIALPAIARATGEAKPVERKAKEKPEKPAKPIAGGTMTPPEELEREAEGDRFIITGAQNNSHLHPSWRSLCNYAIELGAPIMAVPITYNKNAWERASGVTRDSEEIWYDPECRDYLVDGPIRLAPDLLLCAEVDRLPTAVDPLSGLEGYTRESSGIFASPRVAMRSLASMKGEMPRFLYSTGVCTQRNYVNRFAGQRAAFHHTYGGLLVERDPDGAWWVRQLIADEEGCFYDLDTLWTPDGPIRGQRAAAVVWGDVHERFLEQHMREACWGDGGILDTLRPDVQVLPDVLHFTGRSHHGIKCPFFLAEARRDGTAVVEHEVAGTARFLREAEAEAAREGSAQRWEKRHAAARRAAAEVSPDVVETVRRLIADGAGGVAIEQATGLGRDVVVALRQRLASTGRQA
jgi:hypothetical protein